jgi:DNA-binding transcriptional MerR regulator
MAYTLPLPTMYTVAQVARHIGTSATTVRNWSADYADFLSLTANPEPGTARAYTEEDVRVLATVATLRAQLANVEDIRAALDQGQRLEPMPPTEGDETAENDTASTTGQPNALTLYVNRVTSLETRVEDLTDRLIDAEKRAAAAQKELDILRELYQAATSQDQDPDRPMSFWEWVQSKRR